jgi:hypothetical protein
VADLRRRRSTAGGWPVPTPTRKFHGNGAWARPPLAWELADGGAAGGPEFLARHQQGEPARRNDRAGGLRAVEAGAVVVVEDSL